ncbi:MULTISPECIES: hypothetical protein [unclassified Thiocapsa]|uniref:hypothetical protein n=1 Tax=unclassified Thiocapsa TaxID=2641286 RepID=UPI0035B1EE2E
MANLESVISGLRAALGKATGDFSALRASVERLKQEREDVAAAPTNRVDIIDALNLRIDGAAAHYREALDRQLDHFAGIGPSYVARHLDLERSEETGLFHLLRHYKTWDAPRKLETRRSVSDAALCFFVGPETIKAKLAERVAALRIPNEGLPAAAREKRLEELDRQIEKAEGELQAIRDAAREAGLVLADPEGVREPSGPRITFTGKGV